MEEQEHKGWLRALFGFLKDKFDLNADQARQDEVVENISRGVEFKGTNLWVLIFATFIASLGLNVNSAAVIIGAMLISPLMGPIMGIGLALGINNFELMKRSLRNFGFMSAVAIATSTVYFLLSPLTNAQSELLARTLPTTYDVLIAFFGGLAGIVAQSRRDRTTTVIPGVAIATALMPPLCTAGFGLATGQWSFFVGALYLFFINTVFIAIATFAIVRFLKYEKRVFLDKQREKRVRQYMVAIVIITLVPSVILGYRIVRRTIFETNADRYISSVFHFPHTQVIDCNTVYDTPDGYPQIDLLVVGEPLSDDVIENCRAQMTVYGLHDAHLTVRQADGSERIDVGALQKSYIEMLDEKSRRIEELQQRLGAYTTDTLACRDIVREAGTLFANLGGLSLAGVIEYDVSGRAVDTMLIGIAHRIDVQQGLDTARLASWLKVRTHHRNIRIYPLSLQSAEPEPLP